LILAVFMCNRGRRQERVWTAQRPGRSVEKIILVGFVANTCIEGTARFGMELGYHVTLIKDATAAFDREGMHAAHEVNGPRFAHAILTTDELLLYCLHQRNARPPRRQPEGRPACLTCTLIYPAPIPSR